MIGNLLGPELKAYIEARNFAALREVLCQFAAPDIAEILADMSAADKALSLRILSHQLAADVFERERDSRPPARLTLGRVTFGAAAS